MHKLTNDRMKWGRWAFLAGGALLAFALLVRPYLWIRMPGAVASVGGKPFAPVAVYGSPDGQLLVNIQEPWGVAVFIIDPSEGSVTAPCFGSLMDDLPENNHFMIMSWFALTMDDDYHPGFTHHFDDDWPGPGSAIKPGEVTFTERLPSGATRRVQVNL
jgi:hypothetical protein